MRRLRPVLVAALSGLLLAVAFPKADLGFLAWAALAPLLVIIRGRSIGAAAALGWVTGFSFFSSILYWIPDTVSNFTTIAPSVATGLWFLMAAACAYSFAVFAAVVEWLAARGIARTVAAPAVWVVLEWARTFVIAGFPWASLGYSQMEYPVLVQAADLGGVYLISAFLILANAAMAEMVVAREAQKGGGSDASLHVAGAAPSKHSRRFALLFVALPLVLALYGSLALRSVEQAPVLGSVRVGVVQGNVAQDQKWDPALREKILDRYLSLSEDVASMGAELVLWPEAAVPFYLGLDARAQKLARFAVSRDVWLLTGSPGVRREDEVTRPYNQAWLVGPDGHWREPYDKIQLVPFGEYIPLGGLFGRVRIAAEAVGQFGRGTEHKVFEGPAILATAGGAAALGRPARFAPLICYEGIFPALTRRFAAAGADFLVNISNDAWYGDTSAPHQHLAMIMLRAVENRIPLVRATNTGISGFVSADGSVRATTALFEEDIAVQTLLLRDIFSFYRRFGDVFVALCGLLVLALFAVASRRGPISAR
ncbi:MAG: apolipoprotein N-acyltransferase [Hyphomicrobiaceae bacterium]|jgi:apolipoprotein N-acyltransferase